MVVKIDKDLFKNIFFVFLMNISKYVNVELENFFIVF